MAGANCPPDLMRRAADEMNMKEIISVYGQTEASPGCTMGEVNEDLDHRVETVGTAFPGVECKVIDPETGVLTISGEGAMEDYSVGGQPWYAYRVSIKKVVIEDGVTSIGNNAFCECKNLTDEEKNFCRNHIKKIKDIPVFFSGMRYGELYSLFKCSTKNFPARREGNTKQVSEIELPCSL